MFVRETFTPQGLTAGGRGPRAVSIGGLFFVFVWKMNVPI